MLMATKIRRWTLEELNHLPGDGNTYELVHGELLVSPAPAPPHDDVGAQLLRILFPYVEAQRVGLIYLPHSVVQVLPDSQVEPDLMVHPGPRRPLEPFAERAMPILVIEILSKHSRRRDRVLKRGFYLEQAIPDYWIVDAEGRSITTARPGSNDVVVTEQLVWHPWGARTPLSFDVAAMFRQALGQVSAD